MTHNEGLRYDDTATASPAAMSTAPHDKIIVTDTIVAPSKGRTKKEAEDP